MIQKCISLCVIVLICGSIHAAQPQRLVIDTAVELGAGETESVTLLSDGRLEIAPAIKEIDTLEEKHIWKAVSRGKGKGVFIGTGENGELFFLNPLNKLVKITEFSEADIYAVEVDNRGNAYVATSPGGKIFRVHLNGDVEVYFEHDEKYVWDLIVDGRGDLFVATGTDGKIYRVTDEKRGEIFYDSDEANIRSLALDKTGHLLAGSIGRGIVYRIPYKGKAVALLDAGKTEINQILVTPTGDIYVSAIGATSKKTSSSASLKPKLNKAMLDVKGMVTVNSSSSNSNISNKSSASSSSSSKSVSSKNKSYLYRIHKDLYPEVVWTTNDVIHSLAWHDDGLLIGVGNKGQVYQYYETRSLARLFEVGAEQVVSIVPLNKRELLVLTNNKAKAFVVRPDGLEKGIYRSQVIDSKLFARWGKVRVFGEGRWQVRSRTGNTSEPDKSWYDWRAVTDATIQSAGARYAQVEIVLQSGFIDRIEIHYLPKNQPPVVDKIKVLEPEIGYRTYVPNTSSSTVKAASQLLGNKTSSATTSRKQLRMFKERGLRTVIWQTNDANNDHLLAQIEIKKQGDKDWEILADQLDNHVFSWDTSGWEDGDYRVRITVNDLPSNIEEEALEAKKESDVWTIDHTAPEIVVTREAGETLQIRVVDSTSLLQSVSISENGRDYRMVHPVDGVLDSKEEEFEVMRKNGGSLYLRAVDLSGNVGGLKK